MCAYFFGGEFKFLFSLEVLDVLLYFEDTLEEVGEKKGFTRERARQIQDGVLKFFLKTRMFKDANA